MKKIIFTFLSVVAFLTSCSDGETYADQKEREQRVIENFEKTTTEIKSGREILAVVKPVSIIKEEEFLRRVREKETLTDTVKNEYVQFSSGLKMQIMRQGVGKEINSGETKHVAAYFLEYNISSATATLTNMLSELHRYPEILNVSRNGNTITASIDKSVHGYSLLNNMYNINMPPEAWFVPFRYIKIGHDFTGEGVAKVRLIVPHSLGHSRAAADVNAYFYEITFEELY